MTETTTTYRCQNCDWSGLECGPLAKVAERVMPGDIMPYGECPECGACCFSDDTPEEVAAERVRECGPELLAALQALLTAETFGERFAAEDAARAVIAKAHKRESNARLMTSAPELLEELEACVEYISDRCDGTALNGAILRNAKRVIAKAKGGQ